MQSKSLRNLVLVTVLFVLCAGVAMWRNGKAGRGGAQHDGLFPELLEQLDSIEALTIQSGEHTIELARVDGVWVLPERSNYPVDFERVRSNVRALGEIEVLERKTSSAARHAALSLVAPVAGSAGVADSAARIQASDASDSVLADLLVGQAAQGRSGAVYVRKADEDQCWLVNADFDLAGDQTRWITTELLRLEGEHTQLVTLVHPDGETLVLSKESADDYNFTVHDVPEGRELEYDSIGGNVGRAFNYLSMQDFRPASELDFVSGGGTTALVQGFDGVTITVRSLVEAGEGEDAESTTWIHLSALSEATVGEDGSELPPTPEARERANDVNRAHADWAYSIASFTADNLNKRMADLLKEPEQPEIGPLPLELSPEVPADAPAPTDAAAPTPLEDPAPAEDEPSAPAQTPVEDSDGQG